jgi:putative ABC transport system permease protein
LDNFWRDIRYTFRRLAKSPTTSLAAVITMALGIGVATSAYSIVDGLVLRGVSFEGAERLVALRRTHLSGPRRSTSVPEHDFADWRDQQQSFEALIGFRSGTVNLRDTAPREPVLPERYSGAWVSPGFLDLLRVDPLLGRGFEPTDAAAGADPVVLIGYQVWQQDYGGAAAVGGRTGRVNARPTTVVGVLPRDFRFPGYDEVWLPLVLEAHALPRGEGRHLQVIGRLKDGVPLTRAEQEMSTIAQRLGEAYPETNEGMGIVTRSYVNHVVSSYMGDDGLLMAMALFGVPALFVLLIACVNVTNLLLGRAAARGQELAIRSALGSGRLRTVSQVMTEAGVLALAGAMLGILLAYFAVRAYSVAMSAVEELPYWVRFEINGRVLFFAVAISVFSALIAGIVPALRASRPNLSEMLHEGARGATSFGLGRLSRSLAVFALALSCALAVAAALSVRSTLAAQSHELNFDTANVLTARIGLVEDVYPEEDDWRRLYVQIRERVAARPEVVAAAIGTVVPTDTQLAAGSTRYKRPGETYEDWWQMPVARSAVVSPGYFAAFGVDLLVGRDFSVADRDGGPLVVIVNEDFARKEWPGESPVGQRVHLWMGREKEAVDPDAGWAEVVGLAPNLRFSDFSNEDNQQGLYLPFAQHPRPSALVIARTRTDPTAFTNTLRRTVQEVDADLPLFFVRSMDQVLESTLFYHRVFGLTLVVFGTVALLLAAVGLYGVTYASVMQRIPEMGVRMALGARPQDVVRLILKQGLTKTAIGLGVGLALGWGLGKALESFLFQVRPEDPVTFTAIPLFLLAVSLLAYLVPARWASRVDPVKALRGE